MTVIANDHIRSCDDYLNARTGHYDYRRIRYNAAIDIMQAHGLNDNMTVLDVGAGWTELAFTLHAERGWRGRYWPVDGGLDGTDLNDWIPPREVDWVVALEILEHVHNYEFLLGQLCINARKGVVISTPNPATTDVLGMDDTHVREVHRSDLERFGFNVESRSFYGSPNDSLLGWWTRD